MIGSVGVGTPGSVSALTKGMKNSNTVCLNGRPLQLDLQTKLNRPIRLANDADCMVLSEATDGAAAGAKSVFGVILGTGVGGGLVINQTLLQGVNGIAGEWGHNPIPAGLIGPHAVPRSCYCGAQNCVETWLSGVGLLQSYQTQVQKQADTNQRLEQGASAEEVVVLATQGDACAVLAMDTYAAQLAGALALVINIVDPEVIVLAGGLSNIEQLYTDVPKQWATSVFSDKIETQLVQAQHGDSSGVRGAAWLWPALSPMA